MWSCSLFFVAVPFYRGGRCRYKIFMLFLKRNWPSLFSLSLALAFHVIHAKVDFNIKSKERIGFVVVVFFIS